MLPTECARETCTGIDLREIRYHFVRGATNVLSACGMLLRSAKRSSAGVLRRFPSQIIAQCSSDRRCGRLRRSDEKHQLGLDSAPRPAPIFLPVSALSCG
jgi:hypothetical protein